MALLPSRIAQVMGLPAEYSAGKEVAKIQRALFPPFKEQGFVSKGRSFNRFLPGGLVQAVNFFTMPVTSSVYGQFAIEMGVFLPEVWAFKHGVALPKTFGAHHCELRDRIKPEGVDRNSDQEWEAIAQPQLIHEACKKLVPEASAFFERFSNRDKIFTELVVSVGRQPMFGPAPIISAIMEWSQGKRDSACLRLEHYLDELARRKDRHLGHEEHVRSLILRFKTETQPRLL